MSAWTREAVEALGPITDVPTTAAIFGVDPETVYGAIRRNEWSATRVLRLGRCIKIPTLDLIRLLFAPEPEAAVSVGISGRAANVPSAEEPQLRGHENAPQSQSQCGCKVTPIGAVMPLGQAT